MSAERARSKQEVSLTAHPPRRPLGHWLPALLSRLPCPGQVIPVWPCVGQQQGPGSGLCPAWRDHLRFLQKGGALEGESKCCRRGAGEHFAARGSAGRLRLALLSAAGTVSAGTSSCPSQSQHPSPTSAFRHHYIPYFRGKARGVPPASRMAPVCLCPAVSRPLFVSASVFWRRSGR